ncbi:hypothetical protein SLEP1_g1021 [Rubroshorea leprosula]|uniref:Uncharacterized protein n=1 Tax=Rubroshorea leprosula TaxID=152421 RepID=A0AAV5HCI3_9ROSI|nr:hypothetical protein SLEP1_g1021 [Rubroshorea leprosula]
MQPVMGAREWNTWIEEEEEDWKRKKMGSALVPANQKPERRQLMKKAFLVAFS